ncbi:MAG: hypothetical protein ACUVV3_10660, partial [Dehalococcoidia bacterium]
RSSLACCKGYAPVFTQNRLRYPHTHQYYRSGPNDTEYGKNAAMPTECQCCGCNKHYPPWITHEYYFKFWS